jgi:hypothetical protein
MLPRAYIMRHELSETHCGKGKESMQSQRKQLTCDTAQDEFKLSIQMVVYCCREYVGMLVLHASHTVALLLRQPVAAENRLCTQCAAPCMYTHTHKLLC